MTHRVLKRTKVDQYKYLWDVELVPESEEQAAAIERYIDGDGSEGQMKYVEHHLMYRISIHGNDLYHSLEIVDKSKNPFVVKVMKVVLGETLKEPPPPPIEL